MSPKPAQTLRRPFVCVASIASFLLLQGGAAIGSDGTWTFLNFGNATGNWSDPLNWNGGIVADGANFTAAFNAVDITTASFIHLDSARTIGNLVFGDADVLTPSTWTLDNNANPANVLTLSGAAPTITADGGTGSSLTISAVLAGTNGVSYAGSSTILMQGGVGHTYTGGTILKGRVETTNVAPGNLTIFGAADPNNTLTFDGGYFRIFNTTNSTSAGTLVNNLVVNTSGTLEFSGRSAVTGTLTGAGTFNVITHYVRSDNAGNWSGFTGTIHVSSGDAGVSDFRQNNYNGFAGATLDLGVNSNTYFTQNQASNGSTVLSIGALSGVSSATLRGGPVTGRVTSFQIGGKNIDTTYDGAIVEQTVNALSNIVKNGTGTQTLTSANSSYLGPTTINGGTLAVSVLSNGSSPSSIGSSSNAATNLVINGATLRYIGAGSSTDRLLSFGAAGGTLDASGVGAVNFTSTGSLTLNATVDRTIAFTGSSTAANSFSPVIADNGITSVTKSGPGTWVLSGANTYTGITTIQNGVLGVTTLANGGAASGIGASSNAATSLVINGGTLRYTGGLASTDRSLTVGSAGATLDASGTGVLSLTNSSPFALTTLDAPRTMTLAGSNTGNNTLSALISDSGAGATSLTKMGMGTWVLSNANTYTGPTLIQAGTLKANNTSGSATGASAVTIGSGGALGGSGVVAGTVSVASGGRIAPGTSVGTLTVGSLTLSAGAVLDFEFNGSPANDLLSISTAGGLTLAPAGFNLFVEGTTNKWTTPGTYNLLQYSGTLGGTAPGVLSVLNPQSGLTYAFAATGSFITLTIGATATLSDWSSATGGSWTNAAKWSSGIPNAVNDTANFSAALTAPDTVTLDGNKTVGTIQFNNINAYTIAQGSGGTLQLDNGTSAAQITVINGSHAVSAPVNLASPTVIDVNNSADTLSITGVLSGPGTLTKSSQGTLVLSGANTFANGTTLNAGTIRIGNSAALGTGTLTFAGSATLRAGIDGLAPANAVIVGNGATATIDTDGHPMTLAGVVSDTNANGSFTKTGSGVLTVSDNNTYGGTTTIQGGTLAVASLNDGGLASGIGQSSNVAGNLVIHGGTLRYTGADAFTNRLFTIGTAGATLEVEGSGSLNLTNPGALALGGTDSARTLTLAGSSTGFNILSATIGNSGSGATSLAKAGSGTWYLSGANTFTGPTVISGGTLALGNALALQGSTLNYDNQGGTLSFDTLGAATLGGLSGSQGLALENLFFGSVALTVGANNATTTYTGILSGIGSLTKTGNGVLNLGGQNTYIGPTTINAAGGVLKLLVPDAINAASYITVFNPGGLQLGNGASTSSGITASVGANEFVDVPDAGATGTLGGALTVGGGANQFRLGITGANATLNITGGINIPNAGSIFFLTRGNLVFSGTSLISSSPGTTIGRSTQAVNVVFKDNASAILGGATGFGGNQANPSMSLTIQDNASFYLGLNGFDLNASSATSSQVTVNLNGGNLTAGAFFKTSLGVSQLATLNFNGGVLLAGSSSPAFLPAFSGLLANVQAGGAKIDTAGFDITIEQPFTHDAALGAATDGGFIKRGLGLLTMAGTHTYTGATSVEGGTLLVAGELNGTVGTTVQSGAILKGGGTLGGLTMIATGGRLEPGASTGIETFAGGLTQATGSFFGWELAANSDANPGVDFDRALLSSGALSIQSGATLDLVFNSGTSTVNWSNAFWDTAHAWTIIDNTGAGPGTGVFDTLTLTPDASLQTLASIRSSAGFNVSNVGGDIVLTYFVPEPSATGVLMTALCLLGGLLRRRRE